MASQVGRYGGNPAKPGPDPVLIGVALFVILVSFQLVEDLGGARMAEIYIVLILAGVLLANREGVSQFATDLSGRLRGG